MRVLTTFLVAWLALSVPSFAATVLAPAAQWELWDSRTVAPSSGWQTATGLGGGWISADAPFSNMNVVLSPTVGIFSADGSTQLRGTEWVKGNTGTLSWLWLRRSVDFSGFDISTAVFNLAIDNSAIIYVNGTAIFNGGTTNTIARHWNKTILGSNLVEGENIIAVAANDYGVHTGFDLQITADEVPTGPPSSIPLPTGLPLLMSAIGVILIAKQRNRADRG